MSCSNSATALFLKDQGAERNSIGTGVYSGGGGQNCEVSGVEVEAFVHGAVCVDGFGACLLSHEAYGFFK